MKPRPEPPSDDEEDEQTFDPRAARSNFSLYPPEQLFYCEDCHQIKCPRCITEEILCWYCPSCLFETPSSLVRNEGNRCVLQFLGLGMTDVLDVGGIASTAQAARHRCP